MASISSLLYRLVFWLVGSMPLGLARLLAQTLSVIANGIDSDLKRVTSRNIKLVKPELTEQQHNSLVANSIRNTMITAFEMPLIWQKGNLWLEKKIVAIENESLMRQLVAEKRGVIMVCPHVGNWEVIGRKIIDFGPATHLYQPPKLVALENIVRRGREQSGATLVPTNQRGIAQLLKALRRGEITGILPDQVPKNESGRFTPFFGVPAFTMTLVYNLVRKTGCRVVLGYSIRYQHGFKIIFKEADTAIYSENEDEALGALNKMVELSTEEDFSQYQWGYKRFKRQPDNKNPYRNNKLR